MKFKLKRRLYSAEQSQESGGIGSTLLKGAAAVGTVAGTFFGAKKGYLGSTARKIAGDAYAGAGKILGNSNMIQSGVKDSFMGRNGINAYMGKDQVRETFKGLRNDNKMVTMADTMKDLGVTAHRDLNEAALGQGSSARNWMTTTYEPTKNGEIAGQTYKSSNLADFLS